MLCEWKGCLAEGLSVQEDHVRLLILEPPKVSISGLSQKLCKL